MRPTRTKSFTFRLSLLLLLTALAALPAVSAAPEDDDTTRQLWDTAFLQQRPKAKKPAPSKRKTVYRRTTPPVAKAHS